MHSVNNGDPVGLSVGCVSAFLILFIYAPLCLRNIYKLYQEREEMFMNKRFVKMTLGLNLSLVSFQLLSGIFTFGITMNMYKTSIIFAILTYISLWIFFYFLLCKTWMLFYNYRWTHYMLALEWATIIDPNSHHQNWFLINKKSFGNLYYISKLFSFFFIFGGIISSMGGIMIIFTNNMTYIAVGDAFINLIFLFPIVFYVVIIIKTPYTTKCNDLFYIHYESKCIAKLLSILGIIFILMWIMDIILTINYGTHVTFWCFLIGIHLLTILTVIIILLSCVIVVKFNKNPKIIKKQQGSPRKLSANQNEKGKITMTHVLSNKETIHIFMQHLSKEYSIECLLSFIEFCQFLKYLERCFEQPVITRQRSVSAVELPASLPQSHIITNAETDFKQKGMLLYKKYIQRGCYFEVNISGGLRKEFDDLFDNQQLFKKVNVKIIDIQNLYKQCESEMYKLLVYSYARFKKSQRYEQVKIILTHPNH